MSRCEYDINGDTTQFCVSDYQVRFVGRSEGEGTDVFDVFQLRILSNWGADFICLYRFRVHLLVC